MESGEQYRNKILWGESSYENKTHAELLEALKLKDVRITSLEETNKKLIEALWYQKSENLMLKELVRGLPMNMFLRDENDVFIEVSDHYCETAGCAREDIIGTDWKQFLPTHLQSQHQVNNEILKEQKEKIKEYGDIQHFVNAKNEEFYLKTIKIPFWDNCILGVSMDVKNILEKDILDLVNMEEELRNSLFQFWFFQDRI